MRRIAALYAVEADLRGQPPDVRLTGREERSKSLVESLFGWLAEHLAHVPGRGNRADALCYALEEREGLTRFLKDGRIDFDTNAVERPLALSRKNALFAGSDKGGEHWAAAASLIETCKLNGVDPQISLADLLTRLGDDWPQRRVDEPMPWHWPATANRPPTASAHR